MVKVGLALAEEGKEWKKEDCPVKPFECLIQDCKYGPFSNRNHLGSHFCDCHNKTLPPLNLGRPRKPESRLRNINSRRMNAKVLTKPFKRHRKEFWKKMKAWKTHGELLWTKIEEKASTSNVSKEKPFLAQMLKKKIGNFLGVNSYGTGLVDAFKVDALPRNPDFALAVMSIHGINGDDTTQKKIQEMKVIFYETKDWKKNLKKRKYVVQEIVDWHRNHAIHSIYKEGSRKWIDRYIECEKDLYDIKNLTSMERIEAACTVYAGEHMEDLEEEDEGRESSNGSYSDADELD